MIMIKNVFCRDYLDPKHRNLEGCEQRNLKTGEKSTKAM